VPEPCNPSCECGSFCCSCALVLSSCQKRTKKLIGVVPKATSTYSSCRFTPALWMPHAILAWIYSGTGRGKKLSFSRQIEVVDSMVAKRVDALAISRY